MATVPAPPNQSGMLHTFVPTDDPDEHNLCVFVDRARYEYEKRPKTGTAYRAFTWRDEKLVRLYGDWTYLETADQAAPGQYKAFFWGRPLSAEERAAPVPYRSYFTEEDYAWPAVLYGEPQFSANPLFGFSSDRNLGATTVTADRIFVAYRLRQGYQGPTQIKVELYLSDQPWTAKQLACTRPQPQRVWWDQLGSSEDLGACLHRDVHIPSFGKAKSINNTSSVTQELQPVTPPRHFLPTWPMTDWVEHRYSAHQEYVDGKYQITCKTAVPPYKARLEEVVTR